MKNLILCSLLLFFISSCFSSRKQKEHTEKRIDTSIAHDSDSSTKKAIEKKDIKESVTADTRTVEVEFDTTGFKIGDDGISSKEYEYEVKYDTSTNTTTVKTKQPVKKIKTTDTRKETVKTDNSVKESEQTNVVKHDDTTQTTVVVSDSKGKEHKGTAVWLQIGFALILVLLMLFAIKKFRDKVTI